MMHQPVEERIVEVLRHLGIERAHFAACMSRDIAGLAIAHPEIVSSLTIVCPWGMKMDALRTLSSRLMVITGDQGHVAEEVHRAVASLPETTLVDLRDYFSPLWADVIADRTEDVGGAMMEFLSRIEQQQPLQEIAPSQAEGGLADISYSIRGSGPPLVLFPLGLAPSQWQPLLPLLSTRYCTITLTGPVLGMVAFLEARAQGYLRLVRTVVEEAGIRPGETVLEVGCGPGVILRWLAHYTHGSNHITGVDINAYLLREAAALVKNQGLERTITLREGNGEALPFDDNAFDVTMACTVMEEGNAERMLRECLRVTKSGGRVLAIVRSLDMPGWVNLPLGSELKKKAEIQRGHVVTEGCADASLYRRMREAGLRDLIMVPQWATFSAGERLQFEQDRIVAMLDPEELSEWQKAAARAEAEGTFFIAQPFHCAVGTKP
ncbi:MAG TPA: methyltransferase domain-containing protein [Candidatus Eisenbacteria bacterium]|nr:methyltransferase domain-containing protein [Candidatus Eisenbacteria bacterium]